MKDHALETQTPLEIDFMDAIAVSVLLTFLAERINFLS